MRLLGPTDSPTVTSLTGVVDLLGALAFRTRQVHDLHGGVTAPRFGWAEPVLRIVSAGRSREGEGAEEENPNGNLLGRDSDLAFVGMAAKKKVRRATSVKSVNRRH